ncbi:cell division protein FtsL [Taylorella equigenitalis]|uniref:cell division protein FtsL n=1 Tax=Taylorella equigenitalis TaxID=29575 RepID=UPI000BAC5387|nr:cell division protein FtsL [Taylorella equigenitalis]ASY42695.1 cell division protein FtsL [Taylorella equigenitalis]
MRVVIFILLLVSFFIYSAMQLVIVRYEQRLLYNDIVRVQNAQQKLNEVWSYLQLERANLSSTINVDKQIKEKLDLKNPELGEIIYINLPDSNKSADEPKQ